MGSGRAISIACFFPLLLATALLAMARAESPVVFRDATAGTSIDFRHTTGGSGKKYIVETVGSGLATFDFDGDGQIDIYFLNGRPLLGTDWQGPPPRNRLYRNLGHFRFEDVTDRAGVAGKGYGMGVTVGDYDEDGRPDLYVNNFGLNELYRNQGDGTFVELAAKAGVTRGDTFGAGTNFLDADGDGDLDLFVSNYVLFRYNEHKPLYVMGLHRFPGPLVHPHQPNNFYRNNGDGTFSDATAASGIGAHPGPGMGTVCFDFDHDGDTDIFVCNDATADFLFRNDGQGRFEEVAPSVGLGFDAYGNALSSMGADVGDYDGDGWLDLFVTDYQDEFATLFRNLGNETFEDVTARTRVAGGSSCYVKWGCVFADFDNDGFKDLFFGCGHTEDNVELTDKRTAYACHPFLLHNDGRGRFVDISGQSGDGLQLKTVARGVACDDLDNDGRLDIVILGSNRLATVLRNESPQGNHWVQLQLRGVKTNRDGVGARVRLVAGELAIVDEVHSGRSYQSHFGSRLHFGLGKHDKVDRVEVHWIGGGVDVFETLPVDRLITLQEGFSPLAGGGPLGFRFPRILSP